MSQEFRNIVATVQFQATTGNYTELPLYGVRKETTFSGDFGTGRKDTLYLEKLPMDEDVERVIRDTLNPPKLFGYNPTGRTTQEIARVVIFDTMGVPRMFFCDFDLKDQLES